MDTLTVSVEELVALRASLLAAHRAYWSVGASGSLDDGENVVRRWDEEHAALWRDHYMLSDVDPEDWRIACGNAVESGSYTVVVRKGKYLDDNVELSPWITLLIACHVGLIPAVADELLKRVRHVGPETLLEGVSLEDAIRVKGDLQSGHLNVAIKEGQRPSSGGRTPIPERVRQEVWRRDSARCVDCGSRERLEYDHIIPLSKGGSNTVRNIELRCATCNRRKAAQI